MSVPENRGCYCGFWDRHFFLRAAARSFAWFRLCCVILPFGFPFVISGACLGGSVSSVDYRSEGMLIQFPPGRGRRPCRFNSESETRVSVFFLYGFSLIVRLVREVIKITRGVLARVFFWGFWGWNRGRFWGFLLLSRKCSISSFLNPFFIFSHLRLLIFRIFQNPRHFRTARSGVYMGAGLTDSVIRFGFLVEWMDAREEGV